MRNVFPAEAASDAADCRFAQVQRSGVRPLTIAFAVFFGFAFAFATVFGGALAETGFSSGDRLMLAVCFLLVFTVSSCLYLLVPAALNMLALGTARARGHRLQVLVPRWNKKSIALHACAMFACWFVYLVAMFPGSMNWDTFYQIDQCYPDGTVWVIPYAPTGSVTQAHFSDHHPIFDTLLYGAFARSSDDLFGAWNYGVFAFVVLQAALTALSFTVAVAYLVRRSAPIGLSCGLYLFFCFAPFFPFFAATMLKDSTSAPLFVVYLLMIVECVRTRGEFLKGHRGMVALFVVVGLLLALTKKPGMYVIIVSGLVFLFAYRSAWKAFALQVGAIVVVMMVVFPLVVFPLLDVIPGGKQEARGMLFQQTARFAALYPEEVTDDERAVIDRVIAFDGIAERYDPFNSDPVKFWYRYDTCTNDDLLAYYGVWLAQGLRHPAVYIDATLVTAAPYVNLDGRLTVSVDTGDVEHAGSPLIWQPKPLDPLRNAVVSLYDGLLELPIVCVLFRVGTYAYLVPTIALMVLFMRRSRYAPAFVPIALTLAVCFVTPVFNARYALPLIYIAPFLVGLCFTNEEDRSENLRQMRIQAGSAYSKCSD